MSLALDAYSNSERKSPVTIGIVCACEDGIVAGADRKAVRYRGTRVKGLTEKIAQFTFDDGSSLLATGSGIADLVHRGMEQLNPQGLGHGVDIKGYRDWVEARIAHLRGEIRVKEIDYDVALLWATVSKAEGKCKPWIAHTTPEALTGLRNDYYFTTGIAAPYAELILKDAYETELSVNEARILIAALIKKIGEVDNDVEGFDILWVDCGGKGTQQLANHEKRAIEENPPSLSMKEGLDGLRESIKHWEEITTLLKERGNNAPGG